MTETSTPPTFALPPSLSHDVAENLAAFFTTHRGAAVMVDGKDCDKIGAQSAQILAVASQTWKSDSIPFHIEDPNGRVAENLEILGLAETFSTVLITERSAP